MLLFKHTLFTDKFMHFLKSTVSLLTLTLVLSACSSTRLDGGAPVSDIGQGSRAGASTQTTAIDPRDINSVDMGSANNGKYKYAELNDPTSILAKRSVYFDFDSHVVKPEYNDILAAHAKFLNAHKDQNILVQGNTDATGGTEYNLALGQRRAEAVRRALGALGVNDSQIEAISLGKEKPIALGNDEASYAENRRGDIVYEEQ